MLRDLPLYTANISEDYDGIYAVSLVDFPATETEWVCFEKIQEQKYSIQDEDQHLLTGPIMLCQTPIYRRTPDGYEFNIIYTKETIKVMAEKMLSDMSHNNIDIQHDGEILDKGKVSLVELYIVDKQKGIDPKFIDVPDYSLMATYKVHDDSLWQECKNGKLHGFSLAGYFSIEHIKKENFRKTHTMLEAIKNKVKEFLLEFSNVSTDKGSIYWQGEELKEGLAVADENGEVIADGDYTLDDGRVITVKDGVISSISAPTAEEKSAEETTETAPDETKTEQTEETTTEEKQDDTEQKTEQETSTEEETTETTEETKEPQVEESAAPESQAEKPASFYEPVIDELKNSIGLIEGKLALLEETVKTINDSLQDIICKPAVAPIQEQFSNTTANLNKQTAKAADYLAYLNKH